MMSSAPFPIPLRPVWVSSSGDPPRESTPPVSKGAGSVPLILRDKRVVIVEDEAITQMQLRRVCLSAGMQVVGMAADGEQGVQKVVAARPDIVLLDINMPVLDGLSAAERILKELSVCVVMLTAYDLDEYKQRAQELGTCGYIVKPVTGAALIPKLQAAYQKFQREPQ